MKKILFSLITLSMCICVSAQIVNIPDANFKAKLLAADSSNQIAKDLNGNYFKIDTNNDSEIQVAEVVQVRYLDVSNNDGLLPIDSLEGILSFSNLQTLGCNDNSLTKLDLSGLSHLKVLKCNFNYISNLNLTGLTSLTELDCQFNGLTTLDVSGLKNLNLLKCSHNYFATLDFSGLTNLQTLFCDELFYLTTLNITGLKNLQSLSCSGNNLLENLNLSSLTNLQSLSCSSNNLLQNLNVSSLTNLQTLSCMGNPGLTMLDVSGLTNLKELTCDDNSNLKELHCSNNQLTKLKLIGLPSLTTLECTFNPITTLDVVGLNILQNLKCSGNQLETLNLNNLTYLQTLDCSNNQLTSLYIKNGTKEANLDISNNPDLSYVCADPDQISYVKSLVPSNCVVDATCSTSSDIVFIPDANFKARLLEAAVSNQIARNLNGDFFKINTNNDSEIQLTEAMQVSSLDVNFYITSSPYAIHSLEGILSFTNLEYLNCSGSQNSISTLDLSGMSKLKVLVCGTNGFDTLNLTGLTSLEYLDCSYNNFTTLDVSSLMNLQTLACIGGGLLTSLDVSGLPKLKVLHCNSNMNLEKLKVSGILLTSLQLSDLPKLKTFECTSTSVTALDLRSSGLLQNVNCSGNKLQTLEFSYSPELKILNCSNNQLQSLNLVGTQYLQELNCSGNLLNNLNFAFIQNLQKLNCSNNQLQAIGVNLLLKLQDLNCSKNQLQELYVNKLSGLQKLDCSDNQLSSLFLKNGVNEGNLNISDNPGLLYVCADAGQISSVTSLVASYGYTNCVVDSLCTFSDIVDIPDPKFKAALLQAASNNKIAKDLNGNYFKIDANNDLEIQITEALQVSFFDVGSPIVNSPPFTILSMEGILNFKNIETLDCSGSFNQITALDFAGLSKLKVLNCHNLYNLSTLNLSGLDSLEYLDCGYSNVTVLDVKGLKRLKTLICTNSSLLKTLDVKGLSDLQELKCSDSPKLAEIHISGNQLVTLELTNLPSLGTLECANNSLVTIDVSSLTALQNLNFSGNKLQSLNVNNLVNLQNLNCSNNQLTYLYMNNGVNEGNINLEGNSGLTYVCADPSQVSSVQSLVNSYGYINCLVDSDCTSSSIVVVPDPSFKARLLQANANNQIAKNLNGEFFKIDANNDSKIQLTEAQQVSYLDVNFNLDSQSLPIHSLEGILSFNNLENLNCSGTGNSISALDLSGLSKLKALNCTANGIYTLKFDGLTNLESMDCSFNNMTSLDVIGMPNLKSLNCTNNGLMKSLMVYNLSNLNELHCNDNPSLKKLVIYSNKLTALQLNNLPSLTYLELTATPLTSIDVSSLTTLEFLSVWANRLHSLNVNSLTKLQDLNCSYNEPLISLYMKNAGDYINLFIQGTPHLTYVCANPNQIDYVKSLEIPANCTVDSICSAPPSDIVSIPDANFKARLLTSDVGINIASDLNGNSFKIDTNNDGQIQLSEALQVSSLNVQDSSIQSLEGIKSFSNMGVLYCDHNFITALNLDGLDQLMVLVSSANEISSISFKGLAKLEVFICTENNLESLDLKGLDNLKDLHCNYNPNLKEILLAGNKLTALALSNLPSLTTVEVISNLVNEVYFGELPSLQNFNCSGNKLQTLNLNNLSSLKNLDCSNNQLISLYLKNGLNETSLNLSGNPDLTYVCTDSEQISSVQSLVDLYGYTNCKVDDSCPLPADIVTIPDTNFKTKLLLADSTNNIAENANGVNFKIDSNNDSEIQVSEAMQVYALDVSSSNIASLEGIASFTNLLNLNCNKNLLSALDVTTLIGLKKLRCSGNQLTNLDVIGLKDLTDLHCSDNLLNSLFISNLYASQALFNLEKLHCEDNYLTYLDASGLSKLKELHCSHNKLNGLIIFNGSNEELEIDNNPELQYICADQSQIADVEKIIKINGYNCSVTSFCPQISGAFFPTLEGNARFDSNNNGCDSNDVAFPNLKFLISHGQSSDIYISDANGNFQINLSSETDIVISPVLENPNYFNVSPSTTQFNFPNNSYNENQDYCITSSGTHNDLEMILLPLDTAVPGFEISYKMVYSNKGNQPQSGTINLNYNDTVFDFVSTNTTVSNQVIGNLFWNITNLQPLETRTIVVKLKLNTPTDTPPVNADDNLELKAMINSQLTDETPNNNVFVLNQKVFNSMDPNDIICLEGDFIGPDKVGDYVNYVIRFENLGTAAARNITIIDIVDVNKFDIKSLMSLSGSHKFFTRITESNKVEFIFENVYLPFDTENNDGYVAFKIKTNPNLVIGETFSNTASIYFDHNAPVDTNTAITTITALAQQDFVFSNYFSLYPNPVKDFLNITQTQSLDISSISIYNTLGQIVTAIPSAENISRVNVSHFAAGIYFIKINTDKGISNARFIKK